MERSTPLAQALARRHELELLPSLLVFDGQGRAIEIQQGRVDADRVLTAVGWSWGSGGKWSCPTTPSPPCEP